jgi:hypothetical protein
MMKPAVHVLLVQLGQQRTQIRVVTVREQNCCSSLSTCTSMVSPATQRSRSSLLLDTTCRLSRRVGLMTAKQAPSSAGRALRRSSSVRRPVSTAVTVTSGRGLKRQRCLRFCVRAARWLIMSGVSRG